MTTWRERRDPVKLFARRMGLLALAVLVLAAASGVWNVFQKERESRALRKQAELQLQDLTKRETRLTADISALQTERGMEEALRDHYEVAKEGEGLIIIVEPASSAPVQATSSVMEWFKRALPWW